MPTKSAGGFEHRLPRLTKPRGPTRDAIQAQIDAGGVLITNYRSMGEDPAWFAYKTWRERNVVLLRKSFDRNEIAQAYDALDKGPSVWAHGMSLIDHAALPYTRRAVAHLNGLLDRLDLYDEAGGVGKTPAAVAPSPAAHAAEDLRAHAQALSDDARVFVGEAIGCLENGHVRAAVVLSWVGAVRVLHERVLQRHGDEFNSAADRRLTARRQRWKPARTADDLANLRESEFLDILQEISVIGKSVKLRLKQALELRNGCGHPNSLAVADREAAAHVEALIQNVFARF